MKQDIVEIDVGETSEEEMRAYHSFRRKSHKEFEKDIRHDMRLGMNFPRTHTVVNLGPEISEEAYMKFINQEVKK